MPRFECPKCTNGTGNIAAFSHVKGGECFKCNGTGYIEQKNKPTTSKMFSFSFLWIDPSDCNYMKGKFCKCFNQKARTLKAAIKIAETKMKKNGSIDFKVEEVTQEEA